ncbi:MAG: hypothetical protein L0H73_03305 [Nitrococcus sp.]|nr:hypothetical protein [Nitrococcus sp.]
MSYKVEIVVKIRRFIFFLMLACTVPFALSACDTEGPAEEAGESVDQATEQTAEAAEDTMEQAQEKLEDMGDEVDQ